MSGGFKYSIVVSNDYCACSILAKQAFHTRFFSNGGGSYFKEGLFLPYNFLVCIVVGLQNVNLLLQLAGNFANDFLAFVDDDGKPEYTTDLGRRTTYAFDI